MSSKRLKGYDPTDQGFRELATDGLGWIEALDGTVLAVWSRVDFLDLWTWSASHILNMPPDGLAGSAAVSLGEVQGRDAARSAAIASAMEPVTVRWAR